MKLNLTFWALIVLDSNAPIPKNYGDNSKAWFLTGYITWENAGIAGVNRCCELGNRDSRNRSENKISAPAATTKTQ